MQEQRRVGIIGLGLVGKAMARRLIAAGYGVAGYDICGAACEEARALGVHVGRDARAVAGDESPLLLSLMTSEDRRRLLWGDQALAEVLRRGTLVLDTTTARPEDVREDHARLAGQGVRLVDVCLSGSSEGIGRGEALALVGGPEAEAGYAPILQTFTKKQFYFEECGRGSEAKLIVNLVMGLQRAILAEALGLAAKGGFDLAQILDVLKSGDTYAVAMDTKGPKMVSGVYEPAAARLAQHAKDVGLILDYAKSLGARTPLSQAHAPLIRALVEEGAGQLDNAAIFKAYGE